MDPERGVRMAKILRDEAIIPNGNSFEDNIEFIYQLFLNDFQDKNLRPTINGKFVYVDMNKKTDQKPDVFWHLISLDQTHNFKVLPCLNTPTQKHCTKNCNNKCYQCLNRNVCLYRGVRLIWVLDILNVYNANPADSRLKCYYETCNERQRLKILYHDETEEVIDFIVVLEEYNNYYKLITGYPVFYDHLVIKYNQDYAKYQKSLKTKNVIKLPQLQKKKRPSYGTNAGGSFYNQVNELI